MMLNDAAIVSRLEQQEISCDPTPDEKQIQPASLDLRLGEELFDLDTGTMLEDHTLKPGRLYIGHTHEYVGLPNDIAAMITGRSSVGRAGVVVHLTAGFIDPGFVGQITLELYNYSDSPVEFDQGDRICQLMFFPLEDESRGYDGQYAGQTGIETSGEI